MKYVLSLILGLGIFGQVFADCSSSGLWAYPSTSKINQNSIIVIEGYARSQKIIDSLNIGYPIYLEANGHRVKLKVLEINKGMFQLTQALLKPTAKLITGKTYTLIIDGQNKNIIGGLSKWNSEKKEYEPISWVVNNVVDTEKPKWITKPKLVDKTTQWYGCGPAIHAVFQLKIKDKSKTLIKTELVNIKTKESTTYYLNIAKDGKLHVGHGMCSGAFYFKAKNNYKVRFSLTDLSGNTDMQWTEWTQFASPLKAWK